MNSADTLQQLLAAIVEGSDDAIVTKDLDSIITSWNPGAERLFGYSAEEAIGQPITILFPEDRLGEEADLIATLRRGERIAHFETIRCRKDGSLVPISLTVSPVRDAAGRVVGASKIARDITERHNAEQQQRLLLSELHHRVRNCFAVASGLLGICSRRAETVEDLVRSMRERFQALAAAHSLAVPDPGMQNGNPSEVQLSALITSILQPFATQNPFQFNIEDIPIKSAAITPLALVFYELGTNSVKYGCLSQPGGALRIDAERRKGRLQVLWAETCTPENFNEPETHEGFGTRMIKDTITAYFEGTIRRSTSPNGMTIVLDLAWASVSGSSPSRSSQKPTGNFNKRRQARTKIPS